MIFGKSKREGIKGSRRIRGSRGMKKKTWRRNTHRVILNLIQDPGAKPRGLVMKEKMDTESSSA